MELAIAANDDIYIVLDHLLRPTADSKSCRKIENLSLSF